MKLSEKTKNLLWGLFAVAMVGYFAYLMLFNPFEHIEDRNGEANTAIATITNSEIIEQEMPSRGMSRSKSDFSIGGWQLGDVKFHSNKFSGIMPLLGADIMFSSNYQINLYNYQIHSGNFRLYVLLDDKIIDVLEPQEDSTYYLGDIKGYLTVVAVGESADFQFEMTHTEYNEYYHFSFEGSTLD